MRVCAHAHTHIMKETEEKFCHSASV